MNRYVLTLTALALLLVTASACDSTQFSAFNNATATPSRTPRPTFTPKPSATSVPSLTPTQAATDAPAPTDTPEVQATDTVQAAPTKTKAPPKPVQPTNPPPPTQPQFSVYVDTSYSNGGGAYPCYQEGSFYEVIVYLKKAGAAPRAFAPGYAFGAFDASGNVLTDFGGKKLLAQTDNGGMSGYAWGSNCQSSADVLNPDRYNGKLDVGDVIRSGTKTVYIRFVKSQSDLTPISAPIKIDFPQTGRWWIYLGAR